MTSAAMVAVSATSTRKVAIARPAIRPACAACAVEATPVISSVTTSGMTVICNPFSHKVPTGRATNTAPAAAGMGQCRRPHADQQTAARQRRIRSRATWMVLAYLELWQRSR